MSYAVEAAAVFQEHRDELGFVNEAQCREKDLYAEERDGEVVGAALVNHCVRKPQTTLYELAVMPEYRRHGIGRALIDRVARDSPHTKIIAKCPVDLSANDFYASTGWERIDTESGKHRSLNVWEYSIGSVDIITTGRYDLTAYAEKYGWLAGTELSDLNQYEIRDRNIEFIDMAWQKPKPDKLISACMRHNPKYAIAGDYEHMDNGKLVGEPVETVNERAKMLTQWVENPIVVPHQSGEPELVPDFALVGYSTPTRYAGTEAPIWEYQGKDVHILGGTMNNIKVVIDHLGSYVNSIDTNTMHRDATQYGEYWSKTKPNRKKHASTLPSIRETYEYSILNMTYAFEEWGLLS